MLSNKHFDAEIWQQGIVSKGLPSATYNFESITRSFTDLTTYCMKSLGAIDKIGTIKPSAYTEWP